MLRLFRPKAAASVRRLSNRPLLPFQPLLLRLPRNVSDFFFLFKTKYSSGTTEKAGKWSIGDRVEVFESKDRPKEILAGSYYAGQITGIKDGIATVILEHNRGKVKTLIENLRQVRKGDPTIDYQIGDRIDVFCPKTGNSWWEATIKEIGHNRKTFIVHFTNEKCEDEEVGISKLRPTMPA